MAIAFAQIAFTPNVLAAQAQMGSAGAYRDATLGPTERAELGPHEAAFITARDSFYQATVGQNGWPYMQHRGGPMGFLKVLDARTIGYADFAGNGQYISVGNLGGDGRICLFLMDYAGQRRLKIWGRARLIDESLEPNLVAQLESPDFRARVERAIVITIEAFDWNCPKYITPRYTQAELQQWLAETEAADSVSGKTAGRPANSAGSERPPSNGTGPLNLVVAGMRDLTATVRAYQFRAPDWEDLPAVEPGAHITVPIRLPDGTLVRRQYSVVTDPERHNSFEIAVLREPEGRGGSAAIHADWQLGTSLALDLPVNQFRLHADASPAVLIAGGIGITPILAMARALKTQQRPFSIHYSSRTRTAMAYHEELVREFPEQLQLYYTREVGGERMDPESIIRNLPAVTWIYVCGPDPLIAAVRGAADRMGMAARVLSESFE
jgi:ferredoxin-NADP reductase/predicted pyridoxine 5'-phosphate oxidase superfamily flavin-nucleotide-binding protein